MFKSVVISDCHLYLGNNLIREMFIDETLITFPKVRTKNIVKMFQCVEGLAYIYGKSEIIFVF